MKLFKILLIVISALVMLFVSIVLVLPMFVNINDYKDVIETLAKDKIGRKLSIEGELELRTFPGLSIKTEALTLANPAGFPHENMLKISNIEIGIRILPLLLGKVETGTIKINNPLIDLVKKPNGESNWEFQRTNDDISNEQSSQNTSNNVLSAFVIQGFEITNAKINYLDLSSDTLISANNLNLTTGSIIPGKFIPIDISTEISGSELAEPVYTGLNATALLDGDLSKLMLTNLENEIIKDNLSYQIKSPLVEYDINENILSIPQLALTSALDEQSSAKITIANLEFDINQLIAKLDNVKTHYSSNQLQANIDMVGLEINAEKQLASITMTDLALDNADLNAQISLPQTNLDLTQNDLKLADLSGIYTFKKLNGKLDIPEISFDREALTFNINKITSDIAKSKIKADVSGSLIPLNINFDINADKLNPREILQALDINPDTRSESSLSSLKIDIAGQLADNSLTFNTVSGKLDNTTITASGSLTDFSNPAYNLILDLGELALDDYVLKTSSSKPASAGDSASVAASPLALGQFNLEAAITARRIYSNTENISLENMRLFITPDDKASSVSFKSQISGSAIPEPVILDLNTNAIIDIENNQAVINYLNINATGQTSNASISIPDATLPFSLENINLENINLKFNNTQAGAELTLPDLAFDSRDSTLLIKSITGKGSFNDINAKIQLPSLMVELGKQHLKIDDFALDLTGTKPVGRLSIPTLDINLANLSFGSTNIIFEGQDGKAAIDIKPIEGSDRYAGNLIANDFNLRGILNRFNLLTDLGDESALSQINIQTPINFSTTQFKLENINASVDDTQINGFIDVTTGPAPIYNFSLKIDQLNADRYLPASKDNKDKQGNATRIVSAPIAIPVELFQNINADGRLFFDQLSITGAQFSNLDVGISSKPGTLLVSPIKSGFFDGQMSGSLTVDTSGTTPKLKFNYALSQVALEPALSSLGVTNKLSGKGDFSLLLNAQGATDQTMISNSNGSAKLNVNDGTIKGVNIQDILFQGYQVYAQLSNKTVNSKYEPAEHTEFSSLTGSWKISNGVVSGDDLNIQAPLFRISGNGKASLVKSSIDYLLNIKIVKSLEGQSGESLQELEGRIIPLSIYGDLTNPRYKLDVSQLVSAQIQNKAEEKIQNKIEEKLGEELEGEGSLQEKLEKKAIEKVGEKLLDLFKN